MTERNFNSQRLYKLIKWFVIIVSFPLILLGLLNFIDLNGNHTIQFLNQWEKEQKCKEEITSGGYNFCMKGAYIIISDWENNTKKELTIGFTLPILFFGGTALYKYLFPVKNNI